MRYLFLFLLMATWLFGAVNCQAEVASENLRASTNAFQEIDALARKTRAQGDLPRWNNPAHAKLLEKFWNVPATIGSQPYISSDIPKLLKISSSAIALNKAYTFFTKEQGSAPDLAANAVIYQDEISRSNAYLAYVFGAMMQSTTDFIRSLPAAEMNEARQAGLKQMRVGMNEMVTGFTLTLRSPGIRPENREILLTALSKNADALSKPMTLADRAAMGAQIKAMYPALTGKNLETAKLLESAFSTKECADLCALK